ncbi:MAG: hypothetical protein JNK67_14545 [Alphaproteobacteria bacterium]|nr:hypothetical protein [Alphaproteobacteria bacterium]
MSNRWNSGRAFALAVALLALPAVASAQAPASGTNTPGVDKRQANQEQRIDQGVGSGQLTKRETRRLNQGQNHVDNVENRAKADGKVTKRERAHMKHAQNAQSRRIYRQKHDNQTRPQSGG